jgi:hypothetical protein
MVQPTGAWYIPGPDSDKLQVLMRTSHYRTFRHTELPERLRV